MDALVTRLHRAWNPQCAIFSIPEEGSGLAIEPMTRIEGHLGIHVEADLDAK